MITLDKSIDAVNRNNGLDWQYFTKNGFNTFGLLLRLATDRGYVWGIAHGQITAENDNLLKTVATVGGSAVGTAVALGVNVIPVVGQVLSAILIVSGAFDFSAFGDISKSGIAVTRLKQYINEMNTVYSKSTDKPTGYVVPTGYLSWMTKLLNEFPPQLPKCISPTANCSNEHKKFQTKIELHAHAGSKNVLSLYTDYFNPIRFNEFIQVHSDASLGMTGGSGSGGGGSSLDDKSMIFGIAVLILIIILVFVKG